MRFRTVWLAWVPAGQGCGADEPRTQRYPLVHASQAVLPDEPVNVPGSQSEQVGWPVVGLNEPGKHRV